MATQSTSYDFFSILFFLMDIADNNLNGHSRYMQCAQNVVKLDIGLNINFSLG